jgi:HD domain
MPEGFGSLGHLAGRFAGSLSPAGPPAEDEAWARSLCLPGEADLWSRMSGPDRRHAIAVAHLAAAALGGEAAAGRPVLVAALLHDVGKIEAGLGTLGRAGATLAAMVAGRSRAAGWPGPVGRYLHHDERGGRLLEAAGSDALTVAWAREHHLEPSEWTLPRPIAEALKAADGD